MGAASALLLAALIIMGIAAVAVSAETRPYYAIKQAEFAKGRIYANQGITEFETVLRIKNSLNETARLPATSFTVYYGGEAIGSGTIDGLKIPPEGRVPFPLRWEIPETVNAEELFAIQAGGATVRIEMQMHASALGVPVEIPLTVEFTENEAKVF
jgi:hypothetical protein